MTDSATSATPTSVTLNIKGPSEIKLNITAELDWTVRQLKEEIQKQKEDVPADSQRLIYAGKVLKDEQLLSEYKLQNNHTVHLVKSASRSAPTTGNPASSAAAQSRSSPPTSGGDAASASTAAGIPSNFGAGQQFTNNPLAALNRADLAGPHMAGIGRSLFEGTGMNPADPNMMMNAMESPQFQAHMRDVMRRPEVIDQMIAMNPQMAGMGPQLRQMMQSEEFINMMTNPETMRRMMQMQQMMGGGGGGGMGVLGGMFGGPGQQQQQQQWPPPGAFGTPSADGNAQQRSGSGGAAGATPSGAFGGGLGGLGGGGFDPQMLQQLFGGAGPGAGPGSPGSGAGGGSGSNPFASLAGLGGGFGGLGGLGGASPAPASDSRPPEERFSSQLQQLRDMGFVDGQANLRALLMSGGSVEGAIGILLGS